jgi:hypothetical protein
VGYWGMLIIDNAPTVDPYFRVAYQNLERQITGITGSALASSSWRPWFIRTLKQRPEFESERIPGDLEDLDICGACNVGKRQEHRKRDLIADTLLIWFDYLVRNMTCVPLKYQSLILEMLIADIGSSE